MARLIKAFDYKYMWYNPVTQQFEGTNGEPQGEPECSAREVQFEDDTIVTPEDLEHNFDVYSDALRESAVAAQKLIDILRQAELDRNEFEGSSKFQWDDQKGTYVPYVDPDCSELDVLEREERVRAAVERVYKENPGEIYWNIIQKAVVAGILASQGTTDGA